jgi:hypothetical protein
MLRVSCLGVFDTVGALGVPLEAFIRANRERYEFHDVELSSITRVNLHALAVDENRWPFQATVWRKPRFKKINTVVEQTWFAGSHADVGGGYIREGTRNNNRYLDDVSLDWLLRRLKFHFDDFPVNDFLIASVPDTASRDAYYLPWSVAPQHESRDGIYKFYAKAWRSIGNSALDKLARHEVDVGYDRHAISLNEMVHISAIERLGRTVPLGSQEILYAPKNLLAARQAISATYSGSGDRVLPVVDWDGTILNPQRPSEKRSCEVRFDAFCPVGVTLRNNPSALREF